MLGKILLHEKKPVFKKELRKVVLITFAAFIGVTIVQLALTSNHFSDKGGVFIVLLINLTISFSVTSSATFTTRYFTDQLTKKLSLSIRLLISFMATVSSLIFGVYLGQFLVWLTGLSNNPFFLGEGGFWFAFIFSCFVAIVVIVYYGSKEKLEIAYEKIKLQERQKAELEVLKARAELEALQSKINPHFLFNSLNSIAGLATISPEKVEGTILKLAELFRSTIKENDDFSTIGEEIRLIENYLNIEKIRFGKRLNYTIEFDMKLRSFKIPSLLIQPLVENAIKHGLEPLTEGGNIIISVKENGDQNKIVVKDNGMGINGEISFGYGLTNITKRLENLYSKNYSFDIESERGTTVSINIPAQ